MQSEGCLSGVREGSGGGGDVGSQYKEGETDIIEGEGSSIEARVREVLKGKYICVLPVPLPPAASSHLTQVNLTTCSSPAYGLRTFSPASLPPSLPVVTPRPLCLFSRRRGREKMFRHTKQL